MAYEDERPPTELEVFEKRVRTVFEDMAELLVSKRRSYGSSNLDDWGGLGCLIMAQSKLARLKTMYKSGTKANADGDSMFDAWRDLIGYAVLAILYEEAERQEANDLISDSKSRATGGINPDFSFQDVIDKVARAALNDHLVIRGAIIHEGEPIPAGVDVVSTFPKAPESTDKGRPYTHNPKGVNKGDTIENMLSWAEHMDPRKSFVMHECASCGNRSFLLENLPYDCHPYARKVTVAQNIKIEVPDA
jgi:hypothetical protein